MTDTAEKAAMKAEAPKDGVPETPPADAQATVHRGIRDESQSYRSNSITHWLAQAFREGRP